eukprot:UN02400
MWCGTMIDVRYCTQKKTHLINHYNIDVRTHYIFGSSESPRYSSEGGANNFEKSCFVGENIKWWQCFGCKNFVNSQRRLPTTTA